MYRLRIFSSRLCQSFYDVTQKLQLELCAPLEIRIAVRGACHCFKGLSQDPGRTKVAENHLASAFIVKDLSNETIFSQIHLDVQYLYRLVLFIFMTNG
jgi:hypothetical protein